MSSPRGQGLMLNEVGKGWAAIVAGGTGLYPFSDLIDLLFKDKLAKSNPQIAQEILQTSPILRGRPFENFSFLLLGAFNFLEDIHPVTLHQILFLSTDENKFVTILNMKDSSAKVQLNGTKISFSNSRFEELL